MDRAIVAGWAPCANCGHQVWISDGRCRGCGHPYNAAVASTSTREPWYVGVVLFLLLCATGLLVSFLITSNPATGYYRALMTLMTFSFPYLIGYYVRGTRPKQIIFGIHGVIALGILIVAAIFLNGADFDRESGDMFLIGGLALIGVGWIVAGLFAAFGAVLGSTAGLMYRRMAHRL